MNVFAKQDHEHRQILSYFFSPCTSNLHHRVASFMVIVVKIESLITFGASLALFGKLQRTHDIFKVSLEIRKVGACALLTSGECWFAVSILIRNQTFSNCFLLQPPSQAGRIADVLCGQVCSAAVWFHTGDGGDRMRSGQGIRYPSGRALPQGQWSFFSCMRGELELGREWGGANAVMGLLKEAFLYHIWRPYGSAFGHGRIGFFSQAF